MRSSYFHNIIIQYNNIVILYRLSRFQKSKLNFILAIENVLNF